jgi:hypothetical protein
MLQIMWERLPYKTCHSPNQRAQFIFLRDGKKQKTTLGGFLLTIVPINIAMIAGINFSKLFLVKHASPVGNDSGYYPAPNTNPVVPAICQPVKL